MTDLAPKSFDAVLAEMLEESTLFLHEIESYAARLAAAHAAEAKDAARYLWLRNAEAGALDRPFIGYRNSHGFSQFVGEYADAAIDAATGASA